MSEYVRVGCPKCEASVKVEADSLGDWVTCPKCDKDFVAKEKSASAKPTAKPVRRRDDDEDDERPRGRRRDEDDDDEDDRPRKKSRRDERPAKGPGGDFAFDDGGAEEEDDRPRKAGPRPGVCPGCGSRKSSKVTYTWWGGLIGPAIFGLVKCGKCRKQYMGGSGKPLGAVQIILYSLVVGAIGIGVVVLVTVAAR